MGLMYLTEGSLRVMKPSCHATGDARTGQKLTIFVLMLFVCCILDSMISNAFSMTLILTACSATSISNDIYWVNRSMGGCSNHVDRKIWLMNFVWHTTYIVSILFSSKHWDLLNCSYKSIYLQIRVLIVHLWILAQFFRIARDYLDTTCSNQCSHHSRGLVLWSGMIGIGTINCENCSLLTC